MNKTLVSEPLRSLPQVSSSISLDRYCLLSIPASHCMYTHISVHPSRLDLTCGSGRQWTAGAAIFSMLTLVKSVDASVQSESFKVGHVKARRSPIPSAHMTILSKLYSGTVRLFISPRWRLLICTSLPFRTIVFGTASGLLRPKGSIDI